VESIILQSGLHRRHTKSSQLSAFHRRTSPTTAIKYGLMTGVLALLTFPEQTLSSETEVSQPQKYGTVCHLHSDIPAYVLLFLNNILNPTCLMRFETRGT